MKNDHLRTHKMHNVFYMLGRKSLGTTFDDLKLV